MFTFNSIVRKITGQKISQDELNEIQRCHETWLKNPSKGKFANLSGYDLSGLSFSGIFDKANLSHTNLSECHFCGGSFFQTKFEMANLSKANFQGSMISEASFTSSRMEKSIFQNVTAVKTCFSFTELSQSFFSDCNLEGAAFCRAWMDKCVIKDSSVVNIKLTGTVLRGAVLPERFIQVGPLGSMQEYIVYRLKAKMVLTHLWHDYNEVPLDEFSAFVDSSQDFDDLSKADIHQAIKYFRSIQ